MSTKVLLTGATGFIGSNFAYKFLELGYEVNLIVRQESNFWRIEPIENKVKLHYVDLNNVEECDEEGNLIDKEAEKKKETEDKEIMDNHMQHKAIEKYLEIKEV